MTVSIVSPSAAAVKPRRHPRFRREDIPAPEIDPVLKAFGRHIARSFHRGRGVHIPAMKNTAFGQVPHTRMSPCRLGLIQPQPAALTVQGK